MTAAELLNYLVSNGHGADIEIKGISWRDLKSLQEEIQADYHGFVTVDVYSDYSFSLTKRALWSDREDECVLSGTIATSGPIMEVDNEK